MTDNDNNDSALVASTDDSQLDAGERARKQAILRAVGLDKVPPEQRELAIAIARRYDLDLMLKHLVLIDGRPYITRDALLWVAHRSGKLDGIVSTTPEIRDFPEIGKCWYSETTVWRRDMQHPITYGGRYPLSGQNKRYGPEMAIKVSECMTLRRAFNVSAATVEEQWERDDAAVEQAPPKSLTEKIAERAAQIEQPADDAASGSSVSAPEAILDTVPSEDASFVTDDSDAPVIEPEQTESSAAHDVVCGVEPPDGNKLGLVEPCGKSPGHPGAHRSTEGTWPQ